MGIIRESIEISQFHEADKFLVKRVIVDEMNKEEMQKVYEQLIPARQSVQQQLKDLPNQYKQREEFLNKELENLILKIESFKEHVNEVKEEPEASE